MSYTQDSTAFVPSQKASQLVSKGDVHEREENDVHHTLQHDLEGSDVSSRKLLRKMDLRLLPMMTILYLFSFLDRGNIGNAKVLGLSEDLNLVGNQYNLALTVFFFPYIVFEVPSNLLLKKLRPSIWLPSIMIAWGVVCACIGTVQSYHSLLITRIFLGVAEAGLYPGITFYLTFFYPPTSLAFRQGLFFSAASAAGAFSGLLAYGLSKMDGIGGYAGWRWIFIIEGIVTIAVGLAAFFLIYDSPEKASFLSESERDWIVRRLRHRGVQKSGEAVQDTDQFKWKFVRQGLLEWQVWVGTLVSMGNSNIIYGMAYFLPTIVKELGYSGQSANLLTIPVYVVASITVIVACYVSDRKRNRSGFILCLMAIEVVGFVLALIGAMKGNLSGLIYAGVFIATSCCYAAFVLNVTWITGNLAPTYKRAAGSALLIGLGNFSGPIGSNIYRTQDSPKFILGHSLEIGFICLGMAAALSIRLSYIRINRKRDEALTETSSHSQRELAEKGDEAPTFRYLL